MGCSNAKSLIDRLVGVGLSVSLTAEDRLLVEPARLITEQIRTSIRSHKADLVCYLKMPPSDDQSVSDVVLNPDRHCWPHSAAMAGWELVLMAERTSEFQSKLPKEVCEVVASRLVHRDREADDRISCAECAHLTTSRACSNWRKATGADAFRFGPLPLNFVMLLQRCDGFRSKVNLESKNFDGSESWH